MSLFVGIHIFHSIKHKNKNLTPMKPASEKVFLQAQGETAFILKNQRIAFSYSVKGLTFVS